MTDVVELSFDMPAIGDSNSVRDLLINILAALLWAILGAGFYRYVYTPVRRSRTVLSRILPYDFGSPVTICYGILPPQAGSVYYTVEEGDLAAINHAGSTITAQYNRSGVHTVSHHVAQANLAELPNILSISGPKWNHVTEMMIGRLGSPISFDETDALIVQRSGSPTADEYRAVRGSDGDEQICFGFICAGETTTATGRRQRVVVCAGLNTLSTYGAVVFLMSLGQAFSFRSHPGLARARAGKRWAVLLKVENTSNSTRTTATRSPIDPNQVAIEVVSVLTDADFTPPYVYRF
ncbi:MAG TPA: hypothetical protein VIS29_11230 [Streptomyces sp.]